MGILDAFKKEAKPEVKMIDHTITQEDLDANTSFVTEGVKVGDIVQIPSEQGVTLDPHSVTEQLFKHPEFAEAGYAVGDAIVPPNAESTTEDIFFIVLTEEDVAENAEYGKVGQSGFFARKPVVASTTEKSSDELANEEHAREQARINDEPVLTYAGKVVIVNTIRIVNETEYHHIRTADGAEFDLTKEDYQIMIDAATR